MTVPNAGFSSVPGVNVEHPQGRKPRRRVGLIVLILVWLVALVLGGLGLWWYFGGRQTSSAFVSAPQVTRMVDLSWVAPDARQVPVTVDHEFLRSDTMRIHRLRSDAGDVLVGVDQGTQTTFPTWVVPIMDGPETECFAADDSVTCGSQVIMLADGRVQAAESASEDGSGQTDDTNNSDGQTSSGPTKEGQLASDDTSDQNEVSGQAVAVATLPMVRLMADSGSGAGFVVDDAGHLNQGSTTVTGIELAGGSAWGIPASGDGADAEGFWFICDGTTLVGVQDGKVIWTKDLDESSVALKHFDQETPAWFASVGVVVIADRTGIHAYSADDGSELWTLEVEVASWSHDGDEVALSTGQTLATARFTPEATDTPQSSAITAPQPTTPVPADEEIMNGTFEIPWQCGSKVKSREGTDIFQDDYERLKELDYTSNFQDGMIVSFPDGNVLIGNSKVRIEGISQSVINGQVFSAVALACFGNIGIYPEDYVGLYDQDMKLVASLTGDDFVSEDEQRASQTFAIAHFLITSIDLIGNTLSVENAGINLVANEDLANPNTGYGEGVFSFDHDHFTRLRVTVWDDLTDTLVWSWPDQVGAPSAQLPETAEPEPEPTAASSDFKSRAIQKLKDATPTQVSESSIFRSEYGDNGEYLFMPPSQFWACGILYDHENGYSSAGCQLSSYGSEAGIRIPTDELVEFNPNDPPTTPIDLSVTSGAPAYFWKSGQQEHVNYNSGEQPGDPLSYGQSISQEGYICTTDAELGVICATTDFTHGFQLSSTHVETW